MKIAILGRTKPLYDAALLLAKSGHEIVVVGTCCEAPEYEVGRRDFKLLAKELGADFFDEPNLNKPEIMARLKSYRADIGVSLNWLTVIGAETLDAFPLGLLNCHAGDLPRYRGNACPNWAIIAGEDKVGLCIHLMRGGELDSGDIVIKRYYPVNQSTTIGDLYAYFNQDIPQMFLEAVEGLGNNSIKPTRQPDDPQKALRCYPRKPEDSRINWADGAINIDRLVRASSAPFVGAYTFYQRAKMTVWVARARPVSTPFLAVPGQVIERNRTSGEISIACGQDVLIISEIQMEGGEKTAPASVIRSLRDRLGLDLENDLYRLQQEVTKLQLALGAKPILG